MMKYLSSPLRLFIYIRECLLYEAYFATRKMDYAIMYVGVFDAMISTLMIVFVESMLPPESRIMGALSIDGELNSSFALLVFSWLFIDVFYFNVIFDGREIISRFEGFSRKKLKLAKVIAFTYACLAIAALLISGSGKL